MGVPLVLAVVSTATLALETLHLRQPVDAVGPLPAREMSIVRS